MFTIEQISDIHAKVKSGADFPRYVYEMKMLGVSRYRHFVSDGHIEYEGAGRFIINGAAKWELREIADKADANLLEDALNTHQQGRTDYLTFCRQAAAAGVQHWIVDMERMACSYYDKAGNMMITERIPGWQG